MTTLQAPWEIAAAMALVEELCKQYQGIEDQRLISVAPLYAHELPRRLREFLEWYRVAEPSAACMISGFPVQDEANSPTPRQEVFFLLCAVLVGDVFAWATQHDGRIMHNVLPIREHQNEQLGTGCEMTLFWHTEDTFSPHKGDYVTLMCLRNPDGVATTLCDADSIDWSGVDVDLLFAAEYPIRPDGSHLPSVGITDRQRQDPVTERLVAKAGRRIMGLYENPPKKPVLYGDRSRPYMSLDPCYMPICSRHDGAAAPGRVRRVHQGDRHGPHPGRVVLRPGDIIFIGSFRAVHGRDPFMARYDGTDRWLKRLNVSRNLRASRGARRSSTDRVVF